MRAKPELFIPASSLEVLKIAVIFGADAVYIGGEAFGLRAKARNFSMEDMKEGIEFAHQHHVKVYVTANKGELPNIIKTLVLNDVEVENANEKEHTLEELFFDETKGDKKDE